VKREDTARYADIFAALGSESRLEIVRLLLASHPEGMIVGDIQSALDIPGSTLSHYLEKLRVEGLVNVRKDKQWLWYSANSQALQELLSFLYVECCTRSHVVEPIKITVLLWDGVKTGASRRLAL
jgi:ATP-dependent Clp protease ATP-binding subunit ClpC